MKKNVHTIKAGTLAKLFTSLKKLENKNAPIKIGGIPASSFLLANTDFLDVAGNTKEINTKIIILQIAGDFSTKPEDLANSIKLKANLGYGGDEFALLQIRLNKLVKQHKPSSSVTAAETNKCEKVGDCVNLVNSKTSA